MNTAEFKAQMKKKTCIEAKSEMPLHMREAAQRARKITKKFLAVLFIVLIACFTFAGCTEDEHTPSDTGGNTSNETQQQEIDKMYITINGNKLEVTLAENSSVDALIEKLKQGDITYTANDHGGFEKVGGLGFSLPTDDTEITTQAGDVMLYLGNYIVLFYGSNTWAYTRLGKIDGYTSSELRELLGAGNGNVQATLSLK